ncbi:cytidine deaminase [Blautia schinkii]|nr:cytidine deaminase [Blautia schinkii]
MQELIKRAFEAQQKAYAPYSGFQVGAALLCEDGEIYGGCNIENASYGASNCAERTAFFRAVFDGKRKFRAIAIVGKPVKAESFDYCAPCGICRQVMAEFCDPESFEIILPRTETDYKVYKLKELLPLSFTASDME